jgi:hypothetical protein
MDSEPPPWKVVTLSERSRCRCLDGLALGDRIGGGGSIGIGIGMCCWVMSGSVGVGGITCGVGGASGVSSADSDASTSIWISDAIELESSVAVDNRWPAEAARPLCKGLVGKCKSEGTPRGVNRSSWIYELKGSDSVEFPGRAKFSTEGSISCGLSEGCRALKLGKVVVLCDGGCEMFSRDSNR